MDTRPAALFWRRRIAFAAVFCLALSAAAFAQTLNRGKLFEIKTFRPVRLSGDNVVYEFNGKDLDKGLELAFRIKSAGEFPGVYFQVTLFDSKMRPIRNGIQGVFSDEDNRQTSAIRSSYVSGSVRRIDGFKGKRTYTLTFIPGESYKYALAEVGNGDEKIYAVYPRTAKLADLLPRQ